MADDFPEVAGAAISKLLFEAPFVFEMGDDRLNRLSLDQAPISKAQLL
jgi:hypothetical protein